MPDGSIDPGSLEGDELTRWYLRSPAEIEQERQAAAAKRYQDFFFYGPSGANPDSGFSREIPGADHDVDPGFAVSLPSTSHDIDPGFSWVLAGQDRFRSVSLTGGDPSADPLSLAPCRTAARCLLGIRAPLRNIGMQARRVARPLNPI
jgi:hypothetical protein